MLKILDRIIDVNIRQLEDVYAESIREAGKSAYPNESENLQIIYAEQDFYHYLEIFFRQKAPMLAVWEVSGRYVAALRLEQYRDGFLITSLETAPAARRQGFAKALLRTVMEWLIKNHPTNLYAHINKNNSPSIAVHKSCGFVCIDDQATYLDGSVHPESATYYNGIK